MTETSNGSTVGIDISNPSINSLMEGFDNLDPKYYNNSDTITLYWSQDDAISGIRETYYGLGTQPNATDLISWTLGGINNFGGWNNLELENENQYFGAAFVRDSAGNHSDTIWGDGIYIDTEIPISGTINDGQWILEGGFSMMFEVVRMDRRGRREGMRGCGARNLNTDDAESIDGVVSPGGEYGSGHHRHQVH